MPLSVEHAGVVAAAGLLDNTEVDEVLVKGATSKETIVTDTTDENGVATTIEQQVTVAHLLFLHSGGKLEHYQSRGDTEKEFGDAIVKWAPVFVEKVQNDYASPFDSRVSERLSKDLFWVRAPKKLEGWPDTLRPEQIERAAAILHGWKRNPVMTLVGEMGVGKTAIGAAAAIEKARRRREGTDKIVMFIPAKEDLALKMPAEIEIVARELDVWAVEVKTISDVNAAFQRKGVGILILRETTAKQSSGWKAVQMMRSRLGGWRCPACGEPAYHTNGKLDDNGDLVMIDEPEKMHTVCSECSTQMWQAARYRNGNKTVLPSFGDWDTYVSEWKAIAANAESVNAALLAKGSHLPISDWALANQNPWAFLKTPEPFGSAKWPLAKYISTRYPRCYILIIDEAHNTKEMDTDVGLAAYRLLANAKATLQMTGTLYGGVASSIFMLMYRAIPEFRKFYDYHDRAKFVNDHGLMAKISKTYPEKTETGFSGEDRVFTRYEELPGITPEIVVRLLESTVFIKQSDMTRAFDIAMRQYLVLVDVPETKPDAAKHLASVRETAIKEMMDKEAPDKTLFGNYLQMRTGIWDMLWKGDSAGGRYHYPAQQPGPIGMFPKEEALMRIVLDNAKKKRPVLIYIPRSMLEMQRRGCLIYSAIRAQAERDEGQYQKPWRIHQVRDSQWS